MDVHSMKCGCGAIIQLPNLKARAVTCDACHRARAHAVEVANANPVADEDRARLAYEQLMLTNLRRVAVSTTKNALLEEMRQRLNGEIGAIVPSDQIAWDMQPEKPENLTSAVAARSLPMTPAGKFHQVQALLDHDPPLISRETAMELLSMPDLPEQKITEGSYVRIVDSIAAPHRIGQVGVVYGRTVSGNWWVDVPGAHISCQERGLELVAPPPQPYSAGGGDDQ